MTTPASKPAAPFIPYRKILPEGYLCPIPEYRHDDMLQAEPVNESGHLLRDHFAAQPYTLVDTGGFVFYDPNDLRRRRVRPDVYIVFGVDTDAIYARDGYIIAEAGKPPDFALEVASRTTPRRDTGSKRDLYARIGVSEYWRFDHTGGQLYGAPLAGDTLIDNAYQPIELTTEPDGMVWGYSPTLDLCLCARGRRLMYYDRKTGSYINNITEEKAAHRQTAAELDQERAARLLTAVERDEERAARLLTAVERDDAAAQRDEERAARQMTAAQRDDALAEAERLRQEIRRLRGE